MHQAQWSPRIPVQSQDPCWVPGSLPSPSRARTSLLGGEPAPGSPDLPFLIPGAWVLATPSPLSLLSMARPSLLQDLVAWVTVGFLHIPHAEDIPNTTTPGNSVGFLLRPFNFFPEDPSLASRDLIIVRPLENGSTYTQSWMPEEEGDCLKPPSFSYNGTYRLV